MSNNLKKLSTWTPLIIAGALAIGLFLGTLFPGKMTTIYPDSPSGKLQQILDYIADDYVDEVNTDSLMEALYGDLLSGLDPHSSYITAADLQSVNDELEGSFSGIGISFNLISDTINVVEVISGGPSEALGIMPGDRIISINDTIVAGKGWSNEKVIRHLRGPEGTTVKVGIKRNSSDKILDFNIKRGKIPVSSIDAAYMLSDNVGYIKVNKFGTTTYEEFMESAYHLYAEGAEKFVIDLRGNGGGYMEIAILMANEFLGPNQSIVSTRGRTKESESVNYSDGTGRFQDMEVSVLLDEFSASASEIFAGAIQDNDRGLVIGRRSFGKGLVQRQIMLPDSSAIRLTIARYYTPSGRCIQKTYTHGGKKQYDDDILERIDRGETFSADNIELDKSITYYTTQGRKVYGGGGIMPDIFVPNDTSAVTSYYIDVVNKGILQQFAFDYNDNNRNRLARAKDVASLQKLLPPDSELLELFADYAEKKGVKQRWGYINISANLIVNQLKALIARNALGIEAFYEIDNLIDPTVNRAVKAMDSGEAKFPIKPSAKKK